MLLGRSGALRKGRGQGIEQLDGALKDNEADEQGSADGAGNEEGAAEEEETNARPEEQKD